MNYFDFVMSLAGIWDENVEFAIWFNDFRTWFESNSELFLSCVASGQQISFSVV